MSYCRWSSLNWMCDVYCYEDVSGGYTTHVARNRRAREPSPPSPLPDIHKLTTEEFMAEYRAHMADLEAIPLETIGLPMDGQSFNDPDLESFKGRLSQLREMGYVVPDYVFDEIDNEIKERDQ